MFSDFNENDFNDRVSLDNSIRVIPPPGTNQPPRKYPVIAKSAITPYK